MALFDKCLKVIFTHEGRYSNDPDDPGGETMYGISLRFLKGLDLADADIDHDGNIDGDDIKAMTIPEASKLYKKYFWDKMNLNVVPIDLLTLHLFDMGVNTGTKTAIKLLQRILDVTDDGILGRDTLTALLNWDAEDVLESYIAARFNYYNAIMIKNPRLAKYKKGWFNRITTTKF